MSIFRIYPNKSNTIASGPFEHFNSGQNEVSELWYGGGNVAGTFFERRNSISRFLVKFDLSELERKINKKEINPNKIKSYKLKMKNAIPRDRLIERSFKINQRDSQIASSFDLVSFPINKDWDEGRGSDMVKSDILVRQKGNPVITGYSNWNFAKRSEKWDHPGVYKNPTASTAVTSFSTQHFDLGNEDIDMDVTDIVNDWLNNNIENNGLGISFERNLELFSGNTRFVASFFTENTNSAFKPFIEVSYDQSIKDDRLNVTNDRASRIFLYTFSGDQPVNFFSADTVDIKKNNGQIVKSGLTPQHLKKGIYYIDILMSGASPGEQYKDIWKGVTFNPGIDKQNFERSFIVKKSFFNQHVPQVNNYSLTTYGIDDGAIINNNELTRVFCNLRVNYSNREPDRSVDLKYRMIMNEDEEVIPWTSVDQAIINNKRVLFFDIESSWLLHNQRYEIQFRIDELGTKRIIDDEKISFKVRKDI